MKVALVCYPTVGGSGVVATELGCQLAKRGHEIHIISYGRPFKMTEKIPGLYFHKFQPEEYPLFPHPFYTTALVGRLAALLRKHKFDICHAHYAIPHAVALYLARAVAATDNKIVTTLHGTDVSLLGARENVRALTSFALRHCDLVTAVSCSLKEEARNIFPLQKEIQVIPNFVNTRTYKPGKKSPVPGLVRPGEKILIHVSNFRPVKRVPDLLKLLLLLRRKHPLKLFLVGDGVEKNKIKQLTKKMGLAQDVVFFNSCSNPALLYKKADVFLLPSAKESFGLAALEAMSSGLPVIASDTGGLPEVVDHGRTGFLTRVGDVGKMAYYTSLLLNRKELYENFSRAAREKAVGVFDQEIIVPQYEKSYHELLRV